MSIAKTKEQKRKAVLRATAWNKANAERRAEILKKHYSENKQTIIDRSKERHDRLKNTPAYRKMRNAINHRQVEKTADFYCIKCLSQKGFKGEQITPELIKAQRVIIKLKRAVKEIEG